jgi:hypothetical protein
VRKPRREIVICFRLHTDELSLLRASFPENITEATRSVHKLARAAILDRLAIVQMARSVTAAGSGSECSQGGLESESGNPGNVLRG